MDVKFTNTKINCRDCVKSIEVFRAETRKQMALERLKVTTCRNCPSMLEIIREAERKIKKSDGNAKR